MRLSKKLIAFVPALALLLTQTAFAEVEEAELLPREQKICQHDVPETPEYSASFISKNSKLKVEESEVFEVKVFIKNTGNTPWFSVDSGCNDAVQVSLVTDKLPNRPSEIYLESSDEVEDTNWESKSEIGMDQIRVNPGEVASFTFYGSHEGEDILKEFFVPVVHGVERLNEASFSVDLIVGEHDTSIPNMRKKLLWANTSGSTSHINPEGEKTLLVDLSDQKVDLILDGVVVRTFPASTGAYATPTPVGTTQISLKQELRIGGKYPHYRMPKFMWFRAGGYGFHALPYLANDNGVFWEEAWDHIGRPVSHGCVRLLPDDADFAFDFADIGTTVTVQY